MAKTQQEILAEAEAQKQAATENLIPKFENEADLDRYWTGIRMREAEEDKAREEQRNKRQLAARSLGDLGQAFADMIKGAEGAVVSPRSVEQQYQALDNRQRQIYDNYRARMDYIRNQNLERERARAAEAARIKMNDDKLAAKAAEGDANRQNKLDVARERTYNYYYNRGRGKNDYYFIDFGNGQKKTYQENSKEGAALYSAIYQYLLDNHLVDDYLSYDSNGNLMQPKTQKQLDVFVERFLPLLMAEDTHRNAIYKMVFGAEPKTTYTPKQVQGMWNWVSGGAKSNESGNSGQKQKTKVEW